MKSTEDMTSILNLPIYISLLPEDEQDNELDKIKIIDLLLCKFLSVVANQHKNIKKINVHGNNNIYMYTLNPFVLSN